MIIDTWDYGLKIPQFDIPVTVVRYQNFYQMLPVQQSALTQGLSFF